MMLSGIRVSESPWAPVGQAIQDNMDGYPRFWVNPFDRYGDRAGIVELTKQVTPLYTRHTRGAIEAARDRRRRAQRS